MSRRALPYRIPPEDVIDAQSWVLVTEDGDLTLPDALADWDYQMNLRLRRTVRVDLDRVRSDAGLPIDASLTLATVWTATGSNLRGPAERHTLVGGGQRDIDVSFNSTQHWYSPNGSMTPSHLRHTGLGPCCGATVDPCVSRATPRSSRSP